MIRNYIELSRIPLYSDRLEYLMLDGSVGQETFGRDRDLNQGFYTSREWKNLRNFVVARDNGCDLGVEGYEILDSKVFRIHHMTPITPEDIIQHADWILDPEYLITTTLDTHNLIHYGYERVKKPPVVLERTPGDTRIW
jgi:hypothetical protein